jgi:hypothetical protein
MKFFRWFIAGALAVPLGHQLALWALNAAGVIDRKPFSMTATAPFGVPQWISLAFWGGVWGIILGLILLRARGAKYWWIALLVGAIAPTLVAALVIAPLKGMHLPRTSAFVITGLTVNGVWGLMTALFYRLMERR